MQKASASALEFGASFEWLGSWIATVSEKTRQAPESIGNAFNSMMSRMNNMKMKGFNEEDVSQINDVAKALEKLKEPLFLIDKQTGKWNDMSDIFEGIAKQWNILDDTQKRYLATTIGGTRQQNAFLALMNDMSKGIEGGSRAYELYTGALNANGDAARKYATWQESVTAAQNDFKASLESLYALLDANWMKGFYSGMAGFVDILTAGSNAMDGWNIKLPLIIAGIGSLIAVFIKLKTVMSTPVSKGGGLIGLFTGGGIGAAVAAIAGITQLITSITGAVAKASEPIDYSKQISSLTDYHASIKELADEYKELASKENKTANESERMDAVLRSLAGSSLSLKDALTDTTGSFKSQADIVQILNKELSETETRLNTLKRLEAVEAFKDISSINDAQKNKQTAQNKERAYSEYEKWSETHDVSREGFFDQYVKQQVAKYYAAIYQAKKDGDEIARASAQEAYEYWFSITSLYDEMFESSGGQFSVSAENQNKWVEDLRLNGAKAAAEANAALSDAWEPFFDYFEVYAKGPEYSQLSSYVKQQIDNYFNTIVGAIDLGAETSKETMMGYVNEIDLATQRIVEALSGDQELSSLFAKQDEMLAGGLSEDNLDAYNQLVDQINAILEARNALMENEGDKFTLIPTVTSEELQSLKNAEAELITLSTKMDELFDKFRKKREADAAEENHYMDQLKTLEDAWNMDKTGSAFITALNDMHAANEELASGLAEANPFLKELADGTLQGAEATEAWTQAKRAAIIESQKNTAEMIKEAQATKDLEGARKDNYKSILAQLQNTYEKSGYDAFALMWAGLSDGMKNDLIDIAPAIAALATGTGEAGENAQAFANALKEVAEMDFSKFIKAMGEDADTQRKADELTAAQKKNYKDQIDIIGTGLQTGGVEGAQRALFEIRETNEELYQSLVKSNTVLLKLSTANSVAEAADIITEAYGNVSKSSAEAAEELLKQIEIGKKLEESAKGHYRNTLEEMLGGYESGGQDGFRKIWDELDSTAQQAISTMYPEIGKLATTTVEQGLEIIRQLFGEAIALADEMGEKLLKDSLIANAEGAIANRLVQDASDNGFQDQITQLLDALETGGYDEFIDMLSSFGEEMSTALTTQEDWLNLIIDGLNEATDGTMTLDEATLLLLEHVFGTYENFTALSGKLVEENSKAIESEDKLISYLEELQSLLKQDDGLKKFGEHFSSLDKKIQDALYDAIPFLEEFFDTVKDGSADAEDGLEGLGKATDKIKFAKLEKDGKVFEGLTQMLENAEKGGKSFIQSSGKVAQSFENLAKAQGALSFIQSDGKKSAEDLADAYGVLASYTGYSAESLMYNLDPALLAIMADSETAAFTLEYLINTMLNVTGVHFDASNWQAQLAALKASASDTELALIALVEEMLKLSGSHLYMDGDTVKVQWGGGSGGGKSGTGSRYTPPSQSDSGGGRDKKAEKETEKMISAIEILLDLMGQMVEILDHRRAMMSLAQAYHEARGEIQGVIAYMEKERQIIEETNGTLTSYLSKLEAEMEAKRREVSSMSTSAKEYEQAADELRNLQKTHQDYSKQLLQNKTDLELLTKAIKEQRDAVRQMEIDLRDTILDAILDREELNERMLQGTIDLENEIIDILTKRYELERDEIIKTADLKRQALEEEMRLLDEQLAKRKAQEEQEDKLKKLKSLEEQLARITADPTRKKEELALREEIAKLRKEMAWDAAEEEVEAQKTALQEQIDSVDAYLEYINGYYEEILKNPKLLIEEMAWLMKSTDEEIIAWLKENHEDFATYTDAMCTDMQNNWQEMLNDMRGYTVTYWDEVEAIIQQGDDAIIAFLKQNSADYRTAGQLQAEAYVDQWMQQLENLRAAHRQVVAEINSYNYSPVNPSTHTGDSNNNSSGSSGGGSGSTSSNTVKASTIWAEYLKRYPQWAEKSKELQDKHLALVISNIQNPNATIADWLMQFRGKTIKYKTGGMADFTGPAWLDGTKTKPERILSAYQTGLFEDMIKTLHTINTLRVPMMPDYNGNMLERSSSIQIGDVIVQVSSLDNDRDYEDMGERALEVILEKARRIAPVGGIRLDR